MAFVYWIHLKEHTDMFSEGYIGITSVAVNTRFSQHKSKAKHGSVLVLSNAIRKYGDSLVISTLVEGSLEYCQDLEKKLRSDLCIGWNLAIGGESPRLGSKASEESKRKMSKSQIGRKHSDETKNKISEKSKLFRHSEESKIKMSVSRKGKFVSEETRSKISKTLTGRAFSKETVEKLRPHWDNNKFSDKAKEKALEYLKSLKSWEVHTANKDVWRLADQAYFYISDNPSHGSKRLAKFFGLKEPAVIGLLKKIRSGWNPSEDADWIKFKNKETLDVT